jgi:hypothetical protein
MLLLTWVMLCSCAGVLLASAGMAQAEVVEPRLGLFVDARDIERARQRAENEPWAQAHRERVLRIADQWLSRDDEWIRQILPAPGSKFAYGTAGCPHCGGSWGRFGHMVADLDRSLMLKCPHCETEFDLAEPSGPYADHGDGIEVNGRQFWLRGVWNGFVVDSMWSAFHADNAAVVNLADAYALTGNERYARKAIVIMDALATLSPQTTGPRDFETDPTRDAGRLQHLTSIVYRAQVHFARALDLVGRHEDLEKPSPTNPAAGSALDNIRAGIFDEYMFKHFDPREAKLRTLHNHEADSVRAMLLAGLMFGEPNYVRWGAEALGAFLDNTIDRDGLYYESSLGYANFARTVLIDMAEMLVRYDRERYANAAEMPRREDLPLEGNYFNHAGLARLTLESRPRLSVVGREPTFGNSSWDGRVWKRPGRPFERIELLQSQRFLKYGTDAHGRATAARLVAAMLPQDDDRPGGGWWRLYHSLDREQVLEAFDGDTAEVEALQSAGIPVVDESDLFGQTGLMFLRSGAGAHRRGAVMRVGPNMPHAHDDQMALMLFARGRALSADIGYGTFGAHVHNGWAGRAISHHTVVVNQDQSSNDKLFRMGPGGTIHRFHAAPGVAWAEATLTQMFEPADGVRDYRRMVFQIDLDAESFYWIDLFDIDGGAVHDYSMHSLPLREEGKFELGGVEPRAVEGVWTLAGLDPQWREGSFNRPGRGWGERLTVNGMIQPMADEPDEVNPGRGWYPPPGNGYGFLFDLKRDETRAPWNATWRWRDGDEPNGLRLTMLPETEQQVLTAQGPNLAGTYTMPFVIARHGRPGETSDIRSRYAVVMEAFGEEPAVESMEAIRSGDRLVGLRIRARGGREDVLLDARHGSVEVEGLPAVDEGILVVRRVEDEVVGLIVSGAASVAADGFQLRFDRPHLAGEIVSMNDSEGRFRTDPPLPASAVGSVITVDSDSYAQGSAYRIGSISSEGDVRPANAELVLGRARVDALEEGGFASTSPLPFGYLYRVDSRFLHGKRIVSGGQTGRIVRMDGFNNVRTKGIEPQPGAEFVVYDVQRGDRVRLESTASLTQQDEGEWVLRSNVPVEVSLPWPAEWWRNGAWHGQEQQEVRLDASAFKEGDVRLRRAGDATD